MKKKNIPEIKEKPRGPHLLRGWDGGAEGKWLRGVGDGAGLVFTEPAAGGDTLEDGFRM